MPIALDPESGELEFGDEVVVDGYGERRLAELRDVLADPEALDDVADRPAYLLYRGVHCPADTRLLADHGLRYDLTVILPGEVSGELVKTAGHIHNAAPDGVGYPEIYDVVHGHAAFILQEDGAAARDDHHVRSGRADPDSTRSESPHGQRRERATGRRRSRCHRVAERLRRFPHSPRRGSPPLPGRGRLD